MGQHDEERDAGAYRRGKPRAVNPHVKGKYKDIVAKNIEQAAGQDTCCCQPGIAVISQKCSQHLVEQEKRHNDFNRFQIGLRQRKQIDVRTEKQQDRLFKEQNCQPRYHRQYGGADHRRCKIFIFNFTFALRLPPKGTKDNGAANPH